MFPLPYLRAASTSRFIGGILGGLDVSKERSDDQR
jgi:hypothetical protein